MERDVAMHVGVRRAIDTSDHLRLERSPRGRCANTARRAVGRPSGTHEPDRGRHILCRLLVAIDLSAGDLPTAGAARREQRVH